MTNELEYMNAIIAELVLMAKRHKRTFLAYQLEVARAAVMEEIASEAAEMYKTSEQNRYQDTANSRNLDTITRNHSPEQ